MKYNLSITSKGRHWDFKHVPFRDEVEREPLPYCDESSKILKRVMVNGATGEQVIHGKITYTYEDGGEYSGEVFRLFNGKPIVGFKGRIKEVADEDLIELPLKEAYDLMVSKTYVGYNPELYDYLFANELTIKFGGWFGNGVQGYICYLIPSVLYDGFVELIAGNLYKSEQMKGIAEELVAEKKAQDKTKEQASKVNRLKVADLIPALKVGVRNEN